MSPQRWLLPFLLALAGLGGLGAQAQDKFPEYRLGPGDTIRIFVYQNPDLTLETRVTENGNITFPLIGVLGIGGMTIASAEQTIAKALQAGGFIKRPQVNVLLVQNRGSQVSVLGQVNHPGHIADGHDRLGHVVVSHCTALRHESDRIFTTGSPVFAPSSSQLPPPAVVLGD